MNRTRGSEEIDQEEAKKNKAHTYSTLYYFYTCLYSYTNAALIHTYTRRFTKQNHSFGLRSNIRLEPFESDHIHSSVSMSIY